MELMAKMKLVTFNWYRPMEDKDQTRSFIVDKILKKVYLYENYIA